MQILKTSKTCERVGLSRTVLHRQRRAGLFVRPIVLTRYAQGRWKGMPRLCGYPSTEVDAICAARLAGKSEDEIRELVVQLEAARVKPADASSVEVPPAPRDSAHATHAPTHARV